MLNFVPGEQVWTRASEADSWWPAKVLQLTDIPEEAFEQLFSNGVSFDSSTMRIVSFYGDESLGVAQIHPSLLKHFDVVSAEDAKREVQDSSRLEAIVSALLDRDNCVVNIHSSVGGLSAVDVKKRPREDNSDDQQYTDNIPDQNKREKRRKKESNKKEDRHRHRHRHYVKEERRKESVHSHIPMEDASVVRQPTQSRKSTFTSSQINTIKEDLVASLDAADVHRTRTALLKLSYSNVNYPILKETLVGRVVARAMEDMAPIRGLAKAILGDWMRQLPIETRMAIEKESEISRNMRDTAVRSDASCVMSTENDL